jgi:hypothetical protein
MQDRLMGVPPDKNRRIARYDNEWNSFALKRFLQSCAISIIEKEIDQRNIDRDRLQGIDGFTGALERPNDFCTAALQPAGKIRTDDQATLGNKNPYSFKILYGLKHSSAPEFRRRFAELTTLFLPRERARGARVRFPLGVAKLFPATWLERYSCGGLPATIPVDLAFVFLWCGSLIQRERHCF